MSKKMKKGTQALSEGNLDNVSGGAIMKDLQTGDIIVSGQDATDFEEMLNGGEAPGKIGSATPATPATPVAEPNMEDMLNNLFNS